MARGSKLALATVLPGNVIVSPDPPPPEPEPGNGTIMPPLSSWGESLLQGSSAGAEPLWFPSQIASILGNYYNQNVTNYNGGYGGQRTEGIAARQGGRPGVMNAFSLPASGGITVEFSNGIDVLGNALQQTPIPVVLHTSPTVAGKLSKVDNGQASADNWPFRFTRDSSGSAIFVPAGTLMRFNTGDTYRKTGQVIWTGHNNRNVQPGTGGSANMTTFVDPAIQQMVNWIQSPAGGAVPRYVVCGLITADPVYFRTLTQAEINQLFADVDTVNAQLSSRFGANFLPFLSYIASKQALVDAGIITASQNPSVEDQKGIDGGYPPRSLQNGIHLNADGNRILAQRVANHIIGKNWLV